MHESIRYINHQGKWILAIDFSNCLAKEVEKIARAVPDVVSVKPRGSVLLFSNFTGAAFDEDALRALKESAVFDKPFIKKSALIEHRTCPGSSTRA